LGDLADYAGRLEVWGEGWDHLPEGMWQGKYYPNEDLNMLYASSEMVLNDVHPDMEKWGMRNPRHYDILAIQGEEVPTFRDCAGRIMDAVPKERTMLDLGCGIKPRRGMIGVDKIKGDGLVYCDLDSTWPMEFETADVIVADNLLEHIGNLIPLLNHCHRVLSPTGRFYVRVPSAKTTAAFQDPTHVRYFVPETFDYFDGDSPRWQEYGSRYGILPWRLIYRAEQDRFIDVILSPKDGGI